MIIVDEVRTRAEFASLSTEWGRLLARLPDGSPFDAPAWYGCCLDAEPDRRLALLAARRDGTLVAVAPWWESRPRIRGMDARGIGFITNRETPRARLVVDPAEREAAVTAIVRHALGAWRGRWDVLSLAPWPSDAEDLAALRSAAPSLGIRLAERRAAIVPAIVIQGSWDEFLATKSYLFRKSRRGIVNRMSRVADVAVERIRVSPGPSLLDDLARVSRLGWKHRDGVSLAAREDSLRFFAGLNEAASREGWLDVWVLRIGDTLAAFEYDLEKNGVIDALRAEYDEAHDKISPGAYLEFFILKSAFDEGRRLYSCGPGLDEYKLRWASEEREYVAIRIYGATPLGRWLEFVEEVAVPALRRLRDAFARPVATAGTPVYEKSTEGPAPADPDGPR